MFRNRNTVEHCFIEKIRAWCGMKKIIFYTFTINTLLFTQNTSSVYGILSDFDLNESLSNLNLIIK